VAAELFPAAAASPSAPATPSSSGPAPPSSSAAAGKTTAAKRKAAKFVEPLLRFRSIDLKHPLEFDGKVYRAICLRRLTAGEVAEFMEGVAKRPEAALRAWPMYRDADGAAIPPEVIEGLDDDDMFELDQAVRDFLPRRFQAALENASPPPTGASTASPSATSDTGAKPS
jgi:hypothetical protein